MIEYDIWTHVPDFTTNPREARAGHLDVQNFANAPEFVSFPETRVERLMYFSFAWDVVRDFTLAKQFWAEKGGRAEVFLLPSWQRNLTPVSLPASGSYTLTVTHADYASAYLTTTRRDEIGRYVYIWDSTNGLQVLKVLSAAVVTGGSKLTFESPLTFTPFAECFIGFAMLARFDADETQWTHFDPTHVRVDLTFRTVRESIVTPATGALTDASDQYQSLGFRSYAQTVEATPLRFNVSEVLGPLNRGLSQNSTYSVLWAAWPSVSGFRMLKNATPGSITPPDETQGTPSTYFSTAITTEHVSMAFDQTGYEVFAWHSATNRITLKSFTVSITFDGFAPQLFYNGQVNVAARIAGTTDVVCYYLKKGSAALFARFQRDNYATEYILGGYPTRPFYLVTHSVSGLVHSMYAIDEGYRKMRLDATYPAQPDPLPDPYVILPIPGDAVGVSASWADLRDEYGIVSAIIADAVAGDASVADVENAYVAPPPTNFTEAQGADASVADIAYDLIIFGPPAQNDGTGALATLADIAYDLVITAASPQTDTNEATAAIQDIYYGP